MEQRPRIGLSGLVIAKVISDDESGIVYDTPVPIQGAIVATMNPNSSVESDYADNGAFFVQNNRGVLDMTCELIDMLPDTQAMLLGQTRVNGVTVETDLDQSPYVALGGKILRGGSDEDGDAVYEYFWLAKGKFSVPESGGETKRDSITFGHTNLNAQFVKTQYIPEGQKSGTISTKVRTDDPEASASIISGWFNAPVVSTSANTTAVTVTASIGTGNKVTLTGSKGGTSFVFAPASAVLGESIIVVDTNGDEIAGSLAVSSTASTSPTIVFTPTDDTDVATAVTVTSGLKDNFGVGVTPLIDSSL